MDLPDNEVMLVDTPQHNILMDEVYTSSMFFNKIPTLNDILYAFSCRMTEEYGFFVSELGTTNLYNVPIPDYLKEDFLYFKTLDKIDDRYICDHLLKRSYLFIDNQGNIINKPTVSCW